jgi:3-keto-5-aminohexanoate cleavage enzyme
MFLIESLPPGALWEITGHSGHDLEAALWSVAFGGHARAGFEDNIFYRPGERATSNAQLVERIVRIAREAEREIASPAEASVMLGLA